MNLIKSTGTFSFFTIISRLLGYLRDILIANFSGNKFLADVFFVAFRIPNTFRRLFSEGTFNAAFVPSYSSELIKGKKNQINLQVKFSILFFNFINISSFNSIVHACVCFINCSRIYGRYEKMKLAINLTRITFPFLLLISLASFFSAILNSHNRFAAAAAAPIILNIVLIIILFFLNY